MEDDNSAKAPVTRLRRRLSVESTEERSSTPNTPTKKRGRPSKLIQIDENDVTPQKSTPKRVTRKTTKEGFEPLDDKPLTPVRRSTRIKSNTSIVSDTVATTTGDTPRAKRVTRRNSQLGSDSEIPLTPAKQTRRTRKDSTPNIDKDEIEKAVPSITEIIAEEVEFVEKSFITPSHSPSNNKSKNSSGIIIDQGEKKSNNSVIDDSKNKSIVKCSSPPSPDIQKENISPGPKHNKKGNLSASSIELLNNVDKFSKTDTLNKTTSFMESNMKPYKKRTMSWSTNSSTSDETLKQEQKDININKSQNNNESAIDRLSQNSQSLKTVKVIVDKMDIDQICNKSLTENKHKDTSSEELFNKDPSHVSKPEIIIEEFTTEINIQKTQYQFVPDVDVSSTNVNVSLHKSNRDETMNASHGEKKINDSVEPMDIDQTIPESMIIPEEKESFTELNNKSRKSSISFKSKRNSSVSQAFETENKSTLILSQPNDNPLQINILGKSPMPSDNTFLSKSLVDLDKTQSLDKEPKNQPITCLTSTPLQQKPLQKLIAPMNTSIIKSSDNIDGTPKSFVETDSPLVKNENNKLSSASKSLMVDEDCDDKVPKDEMMNSNQSIKSVNDSQIKNKDDCKNISMINKSNVITPKDKDCENKVSTESIESKEDQLMVNVHSSDEDTGDEMPNLKLNVNESKRKSKKKKMLINDESDDSEISSDESIAKNDLVNDEADDAGDDYESGDSQDEEDLQYAKENEIIDKGVTLTSDEDFSNDSDYEKDSFIVSSDEEDNQLLEGTEDDLSMSDNELKMTAKSKKKYNERMIKEQKKASREMFESRHKLNIKKKNIIKDDSVSKSDDDNSPKQRKKNNRMRLDSSHEISGLNESKSRTEIKKHLSESNVNETFNEKEMTQMNVSSKESDPLATSMKKDPKSPKKGNNETNTTLDSEVSSNRSQLNNLEKGDENPLESEKDDETSSDSDTNNIISNYDSILSTLNKASKIDTSLNLDVKKKMKNKRASIIDELNLTQSGKKESLSNTTPKQNPNKTDLVKDDDNSSSDSINLNLLISEDSNTDSINTKNEDEVVPLKESEAKTDLTNNEEENMDCGSENLFFIDTKGDLGDDAPAEEKIIKDNNISNIKTPKSEKKKQRLSKSQTDINVTLIEDSDHQNTSSAKTPKSDKKKQVFEAMADNDTSINVKTPKSEKKKKQKSSESIADIEDASTEDIIQIQNTSSVKTPKSEKKKKQKSSESIADIEDASTENIIQIQNTSSVKTPKSEKKKKQKLSESADAEDAPVEEKIIKDQNIFNRTPQSDKKQKKSKSLTAETPTEEIPDQNTSSVKTPNDKKRKRLSKSHLDIEAEQAEDLNTSNVKTPKSEKKMRQKLSQSQIDIDVEPDDKIDQNASSITLKSEKKKKNKLSESVADFDDSEFNLSNVKTPKSDKKKKQEFSESQGNIRELDSSNVKSPKSANKKKLSLLESQTNIQELNSCNAKSPKSGEKKKQDLSEFQNNQEPVSKVNTPKSEKKKNLDVSQTNIEVSEAPINEIVAEMNSNVKTPKSDKKKKRKSGNIEDANVVEVSVIKTPKSAEKLPQTHVEDLVNKQEIDLIKTKGEKKKKKQMLQSADSVEGQSEDLVMGKKKRKRSNTVLVEEVIETTSHSNGNEKKKRKIKNTDETVKADVKKSKKRKEREDDEHDHPKVQPSSSKMTVPRLPMSVITQLADNPKIQARKKPKVISTSQFIVEDYRRKMPSTYLEESVYLNDDSPEKKKPKKKIPKVLPSMPSTSSSNQGFTTTFKINVISAETKFVAQADNVANFREDCLYNKNRKRRTFQHLKKHTSSKLSKF
ncbi:dentin sialophosphoprotein isoform X2 [Pieris brassicae]|uniref:dentin sialophosphoprotein isoform X2 n=1 Tax=Pieris brassicae TaxID=7116 RepID=UPI001E660CBE|nr:dentin sialophosphoprotein isoform X2 [Pieris brassicae]